MADYKDALEWEPHDFNDTIVTLDGVHKCEGLNSIEVARKNPKWSTQSVASGAAQEVKDTSREGSIKFTFIESSATTDYIVAAMNEDRRVKVQISDANAPNLDCSGRGRVMVHPPVKRGKEVDVPEWEIVIPYLKMQGGSYRVVADD
jgi:hypothetical protein